MNSNRMSNPFRATSELGDCKSLHALIEFNLVLWAKLRYFHSFKIFYQIFFHKKKYENVYVMFMFTLCYVGQK